MYTIQNVWCSFCLFCDNWFEIINYNLHYAHVLQMSCMWIKDGLHFKFNSGQFSGLPTELLIVSILERTGRLPIELPIIFVYGSSVQPYLHGKIPMGSTFRYSLSCPLFSYMEVVGSLICMALFPWAAHSTTHWAAHFLLHHPLWLKLVSAPFGCHFLTSYATLLGYHNWRAFSTRNAHMVHTVN